MTRQFTLATMIMGIMTMPAFAVGTVNQSLAQIPGSTNFVFTENWTADAANGSVPATVISGTISIQGFRIVSVEIAPGSPAPTNNYTVTLTDFSGADILGGSGASQSSTTPSVLPSLSTAPPIYGSLTVNVTGNSVNSAKGSIFVYFAPVSQVIGNTPTGASLTGNNLLTGANTFQGTSTFSGTSTFTGATLQINGCQSVDAAQTFAQALAAVSNPGCIEITPGTYTVAANSTIPQGVSLRSTSGGLLSIANTFTLTINGPIVAPAQQLFTYVGSGTVALGTGVNPIRAIWFPGSDFHAKLQNAYNALPAAPSAGKIIADPNPAGGCWVTTTTASLNVANKYANIVVESPTSPNVPQQGFCDNFTPTITGSAVSISAISDAANLVTVTCSATCTTGWTGGGGSTATIVTIRGVTVPDYNGVWPVQTVTDLTHFTYNAGIGAPAASSGGTVAQSPYAIELDWTPSNGGGYNPTAGMQGYVLENNGCTTNGGCGSYAVGLLLSRTNAGIHASPMYNDQFMGFGTGIAKINTTNCQTGWGTNWAAVSLSWNNTGFFVGCANENESWSGNSKVAVNGTGFQLAGSGAEFSFFAGSFDSNTICGVQMDAGTLWHSTDVHYENLGTAPTTYVCSNAVVNSVLDMSGGIAYDDGNGAGTNNWFQAGYIDVSGMTITSQKAYPAQWVFAAGTRGKVDVINTLPGNTPNIIFGNGGTNILTTVQNPTASFYTPVLGIGEIATPSGFAIANMDVCYADSTAHGLKCSYNNGTYLNIPQAAQAGLVFDGVYGTYRVTTDQTITAGASLTNIPGLSWTFPANTALNVKFTCDLLYSQATAAASDSFGFQDVTVAPTNAEAYGRADTSTTAFTAGNTDAAGVTTAVTTVTFTPSAATTVFGAHIDGMIEQPSNAATSAFNIMAQFTTNNGTIKRGSSCQVF